MVTFTPEAGSYLFRVDFSRDKDEHTASGYELHKMAKQPAPFLLFILHHLGNLEAREGGRERGREREREIERERGERIIKTAHFLSTYS